MNENDEGVVHPGIVSKSQKALEFMPILYFATDRMAARSFLENFDLWTQDQRPLIQPLADGGHVGGVGTPGMGAVFMEKVRPIWYPGSRRGPVRGPHNY
jgi:hypothetical protein